MNRVAGAAAPGRCRAVALPLGEWGAAAAAGQSPDRAREIKAGRLRSPLLCSLGSRGVPLQVTIFPEGKWYNLLHHLTKWEFGATMALHCSTKRA